MLRYVDYTYLRTFQRNVLRKLSLNFLSLKNNEIRSFETSVTIYQPTECNIPEEVLLHQYRRQNLKCHVLLKITDKQKFYGNFTLENKEKI